MRRATSSSAGGSPPESAAESCILVASLATWQFRSAGHFSWKLFWPFAVLSIPMAFLGGAMSLPARYFQILIGIILLFSAARFFSRPSVDEVRADPSTSTALGTGAALRFLAGITGTGGGIFLTPLLLFMKWARTKTAAAVSALYILVNSIAGLLGNLSNSRDLPTYALPLVGAVLVGGGTGSYLGSRRFEPAQIKRLLALVLLIAGVKLIFTA